MHGMISNPELHQRRFLDREGWKRLVTQAVRESRSWTQVAARLGVSVKCVWDWWHHDLAHESYRFDLEGTWLGRTPREQRRELRTRPRARPAHGERMRAIAARYNVNIRTVRLWIRRKRVDPITGDPLPRH